MPNNGAIEPPTIEEMREAVATMVGADPSTIADDANFVRLGVDSVGMLRLANRLRRAGIRVSYNDLATDPTLAGWQRYIAKVSPKPTDGPS